MRKSRGLTHAGEKYIQLDFNNIKFKKMKWFMTLVQNAVLNCSDTLLQSTIAALCNKRLLRAEIVFGSFICSLYVQDQSTRILFPIARWLRSELSARLLERQLVLYFPSRQFALWEKNGEHQQSSEIFRYFP